MKNIFKIFKRKPFQKMPNPMYEDNWKQERFLKNLKEGVLALQKGMEINIADDGRGYELSCEIKREFILEYQKQISEKITIDRCNGSIIIRFIDK